MPESPHSALDVVVEDGLAVVTLQRPNALNALNGELKDALADWVRQARYEDSLRAVLITGSGRAFSAGGDLSEMDPNRSAQQARSRQDKLLHEVFVPLAQLPKPVVAAVNGHAHGAGLSLALACDIVIAAEDAPMSLGFVQRGLVPDCGVLYFLPRIVGTVRAKELLMTGRRFTGAEAAGMGLVSQAVPADELMSTARALATTLAAGATVALGMTKTLLDRSWDSSFEQLAELEAFSAAVSRSTQDHREALDAFRDKRAAQFTGA